MRGSTGRRTAPTSVAGAGTWTSPTGRLGCSGMLPKAATQKIGYTLTEIQNANSKVIPVVLKEKGVPDLESMLANTLNKELLKALRA